MQDVMDLKVTQLAPAGGALIEGVDLSREQSQSTICLLYTSPSPRDGLLSRMPSSA